MEDFSRTIKLPNWQIGALLLILLSSQHLPISSAHGWCNRIRFKLFTKALKHKEITCQITFSSLFFLSNDSAAETDGIRLIGHVILLVLGSY